MRQPNVDERRAHRRSDVAAVRHQVGSARLLATTAVVALLAVVVVMAAAGIRLASGQDSDGTVSGVVTILTSGGQRLPGGFASSALAVRFGQGGASPSQFTPPRVLLGAFTIQQPSKAPHITVEPKSQRGAQGNFVMFTAAASGVPTPSGVWQVSTNRGASWSDIPQADESHRNNTVKLEVGVDDFGVAGAGFVVGDAGTFAGYEYRAVFTNIAGSATTRPATLRASTSETSHFAGYWDFAPSGKSFTSASADWVVPAIKCPAAGYTWAAQWPGVGEGTSVVQDGTIEACSGTAVLSDAAWYELVGDPAVNGGHQVELPIAKYPVAAGDHIVASVKLAHFAWTLAIKDSTQGWVFSIKKHDTTPPLNRSLAQVVTESSIGEVANYGATHFTAATAALNGQSGPFGAFFPVAVAMYARSKPLDVPGPFDSSGERFDTKVVLKNIARTPTSPIAGLRCKSICAFALRGENVVVSWKPSSGLVKYYDFQFYFDGIVGKFDPLLMPTTAMTQKGQDYYEFNVKSNNLCYNETFKCGVGTTVSFEYATIVGSREGPLSAVSNTVVVKGPGSRVPASPIAGLTCKSFCAFAVRGENLVVSWKPTIGVSNYIFDYYINGGTPDAFSEEVLPFEIMTTRQGQDYYAFNLNRADICINVHFKCGVGTRFSFEYAAVAANGTHGAFSAMSNTVVVKGPGSRGTTAPAPPASPIAGLRCTSICAFAVGSENVVVSWKPTSGVSTYFFAYYFNGAFAGFYDEVAASEATTQKGQDYYEFNISGQCSNETCGVVLGSLLNTPLLLTGRIQRCQISSPSNEPPSRDQARGRPRPRNRPASRSRTTAPWLGRDSPVERL